MRTGLKSPSAATYYIYVDETGNLDMDAVSHRHGTTPYFGIATATYQGDHGEALWAGLKLRLQLESEGVALPAGFHARLDHGATRHRVIDLILEQGPRLDTTMLFKVGAYDSVKERIAYTQGMYLYHYAWYLHFKHLVRSIPRDAHIFVIAGTLGSKNQAKAARAALDDVRKQFATRDITLCTWDSSTSWAMQVADYAAWSSLRGLVRDSCEFHDRLASLFKSEFTPWGRQ